MNRNAIFARNTPSSSSFDTAAPLGSSSLGNASHRISADRVTSDTSLQTLLERFVDTSLPEEPMPAAAYWRFLHHELVPHTVNVGHPRFFGHMTSPLPSFHADIAQLVANLNQNVVKVETSKVLTLVERQVLGTLHRVVFNRPRKFYEEHLRSAGSILGVTTSGGTLSNVTALWLARNTALGMKDGSSMVEALARYGYQDAVIVGSQLAHYSLRKAASLLGLGTRNVASVPVDNNGRIDLNAMCEVLDHHREQNKLVVAVVGIAGATETGVVDDLAAVGRVAADREIHYHVDAAWGGPLLLSSRHKELLIGIEHADTVSVCGHKQFYLPQGMSVLLAKDPTHLPALRTSARYQARDGSFDLGAVSAEGSRGPHCLHLHAALSLLGRRGYEALIDQSVERAVAFADLVESDPAFELMERPSSNIVIYRYCPRALRFAPAATLEASLPEINRINEQLQQAQFDAGRSLVSRTTIHHGRHGSRPAEVLRAVFSNPNTDLDAMRSVLDEQRRWGDARGD